MYSFNLISSVHGLAYDLNLMIDNKKSVDELKSFTYMRLARMKGDYETWKKFNSKDYRKNNKYNLIKSVKDNAIEVLE
jgi:hypothetical protein